MFESEHFRKQVGLLTFTPSVTEWRENNLSLPKDLNMRDYTTINELTVLSNLETHNAQLIKENRTKEERFEILSEIANYQLNILNKADEVKKITT